MSRNVTWDHLGHFDIGVDIARVSYEGWYIYHQLRIIYTHIPSYTIIQAASTQPTTYSWCMFKIRAPINQLVPLLYQAALVCGD